MEPATNLKEWTWKKIAGLKALDTTTHLLKLQRQHKLNERLVRVQQDAYAKAIGQEPPADIPDDEDVQVGDNQITITQPPPAGSGESTMSKLAPIIAAALLSGGLLGGAYMMRPSGSGPDANTRYTLEGDFEPAPKAN